MTPAVQVIEATEQVRSEALALPDRARAIVIANDEQYEQCGKFIRDCKAAERRVDEVFGPIVTAAHNAHKAAVAGRTAVETPIKEAYRIAKGAAEAYDRKREEERQRVIAEQRRIAEKAAADERARQAAELEKRANAERELAEQAAERAAELEAKGRTEEAARALEEAGELEEASRLTDADIAAVEATALAPVAIEAPPAPPKLDGVSFRRNYKAKVIDRSKLKPEFLIPDVVKIGQIVRSMKEAAHAIVGEGAIEITSERV